MAKLNLLVIEGDKKYEKDNSIKMSVNQQAFCAIQLFMYFLPKTEFDGCSKLNICFYDAPEYAKDKQYDYYAFEHVSCYYVGDALIRQARELSVRQKDEFYLSVIENVFLFIASKCENKKVLECVVKDAVRKVRECNFEQTIKIAKLSKGSPDILFKAVTYRTITSEGERDFVEITDKSKNIVQYDLLNKCDYLPLQYKFHNCIWNEGLFQILDGLGKVVITINPKEQSIQSVFRRSINK